VEESICVAHCRSLAHGGCVAKFYVGGSGMVADDTHSLIDRLPQQYSEIRTEQYGAGQEQPEPTDTDMPEDGGADTAGDDNDDVERNDGVSERDDQSPVREMGIRVRRFGRVSVQGR